MSVMLPRIETPGSGQAHETDLAGDVLVGCAAVDPLEDRRLAGQGLLDLFRGGFGGRPATGLGGRARLREPHPQQGLARDAEEAGRILVRVHERVLVHVHHHDGVGGVLDQGPVPPLALTQGLLGARPLGDLRVEAVVGGEEGRGAGLDLGLQGLVRAAQLLLHALSLEELGDADRGSARAAALEPAAAFARECAAMCCSIRAGGAITKRQWASPRARHSISAATRGTPKLSSHQPEEYPAFMMQTGKSLLRPLRSQASDSNEKGWS